MTSKNEARQINNMTVNRLFNIKKSNLDRTNRMNDGKIQPVYKDYAEAKKITKDRNLSQIVFGTEDATRNTSM